jgi:hypothetical protein
MKKKRLFRSVLACACLLVASQAFAQTNVSGTISASSTDCTTNSSCVVLQMPSNGGGVALRITGTFSATLQFEASIGGNAFTSIAGGPLAGGSAVTSTTSTGSWQFNTAGVASVRVRASAYVSGGAAVFIQSSAASPSGSTSVTGGTAVQVCASDLMTCAPVDGTLGLKVQASIDTTGLATSAKQPSLGTAGTASSNVITVQGIASMTPLLATLSGTNNINAVTTVSTVTSLTQFNGVPISLGAGNTDTGTLRVNLATNAAATAAATPLAVRASDGTSFISDAAIGAPLSSNPVPAGCHFETSPTAISTTQAGVLECDNGQRLIVRVGDASGNFQPAGDASNRAIFTQVASGGLASGAYAAGSLNSALPDPCLYTAKSFAVINIASATTTSIISASSSNKNYICGIILDASTADNVALVEDATAACASPDAGMSGGTTSGTGWNLAANQGFTLGSGLGTVAKTASTNVNTCLITSSSAQLSGTISYVQVP